MLPSEPERLAVEVCGSSPQQVLYVYPEELSKCCRSVTSFNVRVHNRTNNGR
ncbi:MAG: hypothetical protein U0527_01630 [Candidatus Eisenbacteria bacterium]